MKYLVGDVGATNARFRSCDAGGWCGDTVVLPTAAFTGVESLFEAVHETLAWEGLAGALIAVAGPAEPGGHRVTNTGLWFDSQACAQALDCRVELVNDFQAVATGVPGYTSLLQIGGGSPGDAVKAVLGPGSGLGMATLVKSGAQWQVMPGEGGHAGLAPGSHLESELWGQLVQEHDHVSWETVLCGPGLERLYHSMCQVWGSQAQPLSAAEISRAGLDMSDLVCHQTLETFCGLLGAAAGDLALTVGARGGVYLAGGIAPKLEAFLPASPFRRRFEDKGPMRGYVEAIPVLLVLDEQPGLEGALACMRATFKL